MAKTSKSVNFKNCIINCKDGDLTITEYTKDDFHTFDLRKILEDWQGVEGVAFSLKCDEDISPDRDGE